MESETLPPHSKINPFKTLWALLRRYLGRLWSLADDTDVEGTIAGIRAGVELKGPNLWILICSTIIACIGLDVSSPAVIIGAMLISPLMSPILGIGLAAGIYDRHFLSTSTRNFLVAIVLTLITAVGYFILTPFGVFTEEMQARTAPTILDAFVAFAGGLAGIIAGSRGSKTNAIPGVAIATALMPPLCTAGYGLANGRWEVFGGAFYLFFINAVLISLSTYLIVRILKFPEVEAVDERARSVGHRWVSFALIILLVPSLYFLYRSLRDFAENSLITSFIENNIHGDLDRGVTWSLEEQADSTLELHVYYFGEYIPEDSVRNMEKSITKNFQENILLSWTAPEKVKMDLIPTVEPPNMEAERMRTEIQDIQLSLQRMEGLQAKQLEIEREQKSAIAKELSRIKSDSSLVFRLESSSRAAFPEVDNFFLTERLDMDSSRQVVVLVNFKGIGPRTTASHLRRMQSLLSQQCQDSVRLIHVPSL